MQGVNDCGCTLEFISCLMAQVTHAMEHEMTLTLAEMNLTLLQLAALAELDRNASLSTADLARLTSVTPQNMSLAVSNLAAGGYLVRKPHATNARVNRLVLTPRGLKVLRKATARARVIEAEMFAALSSREKERFRNVLRGCLERIQSSQARKSSPALRSRRKKAA
jgi:DNA-binding MarR family transcriptional regulator